LVWQSNGASNDDEPEKIIEPPMLLTGLSSLLLRASGQEANYMDNREVHT
jgi:hypothetical protein